MKVKDLLTKIEKLKKAGKITDESEVLTYVDEFGTLCEYEEDDVSLTSLSDNEFLKDEAAENLDRCRRHYDELKAHIEDPDFFDEEERDLAERDLKYKKDELDKAEAYSKKYDTGWKDALVI